MKSRFKFLSLLAVLALVVAACGGDGGTDTTEDDGGTATTEDSGGTDTTAASGGDDEHHRRCGFPGGR